MMKNANKRVLPTSKHDDENNRVTRKDELSKEVVKIFVERKIDFPVSAGVKSSKEADYCVAVITNALWYVTNDYHTINNARKHHSSIIPIPKVFENFDGYNDVKRKKMKSLPLDRTTLHSMHKRYTACCFDYVLLPKSGNPWRTT